MDPDPYHVNLRIFLKQGTVKFSIFMNNSPYHNDFAVIYTKSNPRTLDPDPGWMDPDPYYVSLRIWIFFRERALIVFILINNSLCHNDFAVIYNNSSLGTPDPDPDPGWMDLFMHFYIHKSLSK